MAIIFQSGYFRSMKGHKHIAFHIALFILTFTTTTLVGIEWTRQKLIILGQPLTWEDISFGLQYSIPFLLILTVHEFGHYFTARYHKIKVSLPYYIPFWLFGAPAIGTFGAFIRIREDIKSRTKYFDVGVSGPVSGFIIAFFVLWYGYANLPDTDYIYQIHPEYQIFEGDLNEAIAYADTLIVAEEFNKLDYKYKMEYDSVQIGGDGFSLYFGDNLMMKLGRVFFAPKDRYVPGPHEIMHYPWLLAGFFALLFTALNLLPIGQLDGGHITFGLFGEKWHSWIAKGLFTILILYSGLGWIKMQDAMNESYDGMLGFVIQLSVYLYLLFLCMRTMFNDKKDRWMYAAIIMAIQFTLSSFFDLEGYQGYMLFAILLGCFIGVEHPPVSDNKPLTYTRKILGWVALIIFILCLTPEPIVMKGV